MGTKSKRKQIDWEAIEQEVYSGQLSLKEIARQYDCSDTAIRKKMKKEGWKRPLSKRVREKVRENLVRAEVRDPNATDREIIEKNAQRGSNLVLLHRKDILALRNLEADLIAELQDKPTKLYLAQYQGRIVEKIVGLTASERAQAANNLANVQHKRIQLERQAFNLDEPGVNLEEILGALPEQFRQRVCEALRGSVS